MKDIFLLTYILYAVAGGESILDTVNLKLGYMDILKILKLWICDTQTFASTLVFSILSYSYANMEPRPAKI